MNNKKPKAFFGSITSDITYEIALEFLNKGWEIEGTYRSRNEKIEYLEKNNVNLYLFDFLKNDCYEKIKKDKFIAKDWDFLMLSPSMFGFTGKFDSVSWESWEESFYLNSLSIFKLIHTLLSRRNINHKPIIWLWSGPGTNSAPKEVSALITAKICQIKFIEILNNEYLDLIPIIVGPGWVKTKAHQEILSKGPSAGYKYFETKERLESGNFTSTKTIIKFLNWILLQSKETIGGRNFSINSDLWGAENFRKFLESDKDAYKLRRYMNDWRPNITNKTDFNPKENLQ